MGFMPIIGPPGIIMPGRGPIMPAVQHNSSNAGIDQHTSRKACTLCAALQAAMSCLNEKPRRRDAGQHSTRQAACLVKDQKC